jgi:hypothetical protein
MEEKIKRARKRDIILPLPVFLQVDLFIGVSASSR